MNAAKTTITLLLALSTTALIAQRKERLPDVSSTLKGNLILPVPLGNPLFEGVTESVGQLDGVVQFPLMKGLGIGVGAKMTWFTINERALAPEVISGEIRRSGFYGKLQYEQFTGPRNFYELSARFGSATYAFDCTTCTDDATRTVFNWGLGASYYIHATDNLAFGLILGYDRDATVFGAADLGLPSFPGRNELQENRNMQYFLVGMGFSTRFRKAPDSGPGW